MTVSTHRTVRRTASVHSRHSLKAVFAETFIKAIEEQSGIKFHQAMSALARMWVGKGEEQNAPKETSVVLPTGKMAEEITASGGKPELKTETYQLPQSYEEAKEIVDRWHDVAVRLRGHGDVSDNVVQHMMHDRTDLREEGWLGSPEEEKAAYVSELLYIHSKLMIVDDRRVIVSTAAYAVVGRKLTDRWQMGSANINDRSQKVRQF